MTKHLSNFETIQSLLTRLNSENPEAYINISPQVKFGLVTFESETLQFCRYVLETSEWNYINFDTIYDTKTTKVKDITVILERLVKAGKGSCSVTNGAAFIPTEQHYVALGQDMVKFCQTDMNPYQKNIEFRKQFDNVIAVLESDKINIIFWLRKKIPKDYKVYIVGDTFYHNDDFRKAFPIAENLLTSVFQQDSVSSQIHICKLTPNQLNVLCGRGTESDVLQTINGWISISDTKLGVKDGKLEADKDGKLQADKDVKLEADKIEFVRRVNEFLALNSQLSGSAQIQKLDELFEYVLHNKVIVDLPTSATFKTTLKAKLIDLGKYDSFTRAKEHYLNIFGEPMP